jgi:hypothetical protein
MCCTKLRFELLRAVQSFALNSNVPTMRNINYEILIPKLFNAMHPFSQFEGQSQ